MKSDDDQEVAREAHLQDGLDLELQPLGVARPLALALGRIGVQLQPAAAPGPACDARAEVVLDRAAVGGREVGQLRLAQHQLQVAAARDLQRVGQRATAGRRTAARHLGRGPEVLLAREAAHAPRVGQQLALGDADARLVGVEVVGAQELHRVRGHHRQAAARRPAAPRRAHGPRWSAGRRAAARGRSGRGNSAARRCASARARSPSPASRAWPTAPRSAPDSAIRPPPSSASQSHLTQAWVRCAFSRPGRAPAVRTGSGSRCRSCTSSSSRLGAARRPRRRLHPQVGADQRLDALAAAGLVELDGAEQVVQVGDGQRRLAVGARRARPHRRCAGCRRRPNIRCGCAGGRRPSGHSRRPQDEASGRDRPRTWAACPICVGSDLIPVMGPGPVEPFHQGDHMDLQTPASRHLPRPGQRRQGLQGLRLRTHAARRERARRPGALAADRRHRIAARQRRSGCAAHRRHDDACWHTGITADQRT